MSKNHQKTKHSHIQNGPFWRFFGDFLMIFLSTSQNLSKFSLKTSSFLNFSPNCSDWSIRLSNVLTLSTSTPDTDNIQVVSSYRPNHTSCNIRKQVRKPLHTLHLTMKITIFVQKQSIPPKIHKTQKPSNNKHENDDFNLKINNFDQFCKPF